MVGPINQHAAQKIRVDLVSQRRLARIRPPVDRLDPHPLHLYKSGFAQPASVRLRHSSHGGNYRRADPLLSMTALRAAAEGGRHSGCSQRRSSNAYGDH
jgi:hypothetical protein